MPRLKICLVAPPYSGHLFPLLGLGRALADMAEVTVLSTPGSMKAIVAAGLVGHPILAEGEELIQAIAAPGKPVKGNPFLLIQQFRANVSLQDQALREMDAAFALLQPDLVIADFTLPVAGVAAARHGARWWTNTLSPCVFETRDGPPAYFGGLMPPRSALGRLRDRLLRKLTRGFKRTIFFLFRDAFQRVGLPEVYRADGSEACYSPERILACSVAELEFSQAYPEHFTFIGPSTYTPPLKTEPPQFEPGRKHILVTIGTHLKHHKDEVAASIAKTARQHPDCIFHFTDGDPAAPAAKRDGNFHRYPFISYDEHLPRYDLVIHHGGTGVLLHCLKHGLPAIVLPLDFDQFDNAARLAEAGLARRIKSTGEIESALQAVLSDEALAARCKAFAGKIAAYDSGEAIRDLISQEMN